MEEKWIIWIKALVALSLEKEKKQLYLYVVVSPGIKHPTRVHTTHIPLITVNGILN